VIKTIINLVGFYIFCCIVIVFSFFHFLQTVGFCDIRVSDVWNVIFKLAKILYIDVIRLRILVLNYIAPQDSWFFKFISLRNNSRTFVGIINFLENTSYAKIALSMLSWHWKAMSCTPSRHSISLYGNVSIHPFNKYCFTKNTSFAWMDPFHQISVWYNNYTYFTISLWLIFTFIATTQQSSLFIEDSNLINVEWNFGMFDSVQNSHMVFWLNCFEMLSV
jgi:hypothetical protein